jgi:putative ABC transport system permease protein
MNGVQQVGVVTLIGLRTMPQRWGASLVVVIGMACAVGALVSILSMSAGFMRTMANSGRADRAIVLSQGAIFEWGSSLTRGNAVTIADAPGIAKGDDGKPVMSADYLAYTGVIKKSDGLDAYVSVRGVGLADAKLRPEIKLISGRMFRPGRYELITGKSAQSQFEGLAEGQKISLPEGDWTVTGTFESNGNTNESELITDSATLLSTMRTTAYKSVTVLLNSPADFARFKKALTANPTLSVDVSRETDYVADESKNFNEFLTSIAYAIGGIMGLGATFGALNTMYSAVSARTREIATLRAIGFGGGAVVASIMTEALLCCLIGAAIGVAIAWIAFNGNLHSMGGLVIQLAVTAQLAITGMLFACILGFVGGLFPAVRAARLSVAASLRAT